MIVYLKKIPNTKEYSGSKVSDVSKSVTRENKAFLEIV